jgi:hypothetical protein
VGTARIGGASHFRMTRLSAAAERGNLPDSSGGATSITRAGAVGAAATGNPECKRYCTRPPSDLEDDVTTTRDIDAAKDRLVDSLSTARDVAVTTMRDDIAPAVAAAVEAARDASGPMYAEAASRAGDAVNALRGSDAVKAVQAKATGKHRRRRWPIVAAVVGIGAAATTIIKRRTSGPVLIDVTDPVPASRFDAADAPAADNGSESA